MNSDCSYKLFLFSSEEEFTGVRKQIAEPQELVTEDGQKYIDIPRGKSNLDYAKESLKYVDQNERTAVGDYLYSMDQLYEATGAGASFANCGIDDPYKLRSILEFNALICVLTSFIFLSSKPTEIAAEKESDVNILHNPSYYINRVRGRKKEGRFCSFAECLELMVPKPGYAASGFLRPVINMILYDEDITSPDRDVEPQTVCSDDDGGSKPTALKKRNLDKLLSEIHGALNTAFRYDDSEKRENKYVQIKRYLSRAYNVFYDRIEEIIQYALSLEKPYKDNVDNAVLEFIIESVFHIRALRCSKKDIETLISDSSIKAREKASMADTAVNGLLTKRAVPLVFGTESMVFEQYGYLRNYVDFIVQLAILTYEGATDEKTCPGFRSAYASAGQAIRNALKNKRFQEMLNTSVKHPFPDSAPKGKKEETGAKKTGDVLLRMIDAAEFCFLRCGFGCYYDDEVRSYSYSMDFTPPLTSGEGSKLNVHTTRQLAEQL